MQKEYISQAHYFMHHYHYDDKSEKFCRIHFKMCSMLTIAQFFLVAESIIKLEKVFNVHERDSRI